MGSHLDLLFFFCLNRRVNLAVDTAAARVETDGEPEDLGTPLGDLPPAGDLPATRFCLFASGMLP